MNPQCKQVITLCKQFFNSEKTATICVFLIFIAGYFKNIEECRITFLVLLVFMLCATLYERINNQTNDIKTSSHYFETIIFGLMFGLLIFQPQYFFEALLIFVLILFN